MRLIHRAQTNIAIFASLTDYAAGIYATALWLMGRVDALPDLAAPGEDRGALESDVRQAMKRRAVRSAASAQARQGRKKD